MNLWRYCFAEVQATENCVLKLPTSDDTVNSLGFAYTEAGEQCTTTEFGRRVLLSFLSQSSQFQVLLHFTDVIARRRLQAIVWSVFGHTWAEFTLHLASCQSSSPAAVWDYAAVITPLWNNKSDHETHITQSSHTINEGIMDISNGPDWIAIIYCN